MPARKGFLTMRIAMLGHKTMPSRDGGVEVVVTELATRMAALGHDVTVYNRSRGRAEKTVVYEGVKVKAVPTVDVRGLAAASSSYFAVRAAIADCPDVVHFHAEGPCAMIPLVKHAGIPTVATIHGLDWRRAKWGGLASAYIKQGERAAAEQADELIVLSRGVQGYFEGAYGRASEFIPNGVEPKKPVAAAEIIRKWNLEKGSYILYLGRIVPEKGLHRLIRAFSALSVGKHLVVAGAPSDSQAYYDECRALAKRDPRILFTGFVEGQILAELYSNAYLYVLPSDVEGMPMSLLEAMSYGCCCATSDIPECSDVLDDAGVTFRRGDEADLAATLTVLLERPETASVLGEAARLRSTDHFSWDKVVEATLQAYKTAVTRCADAQRATAAKTKKGAANAL